MRRAGLAKALLAKIMEATVSTVAKLSASFNRRPSRRQTEVFGLALRLAVGNGRDLLAGKGTGLVLDSHSIRHAWL